MRVRSFLKLKFSFNVKHHMGPSVLTEIKKLRFLGNSSWEAWNQSQQPREISGNKRELMPKNAWKREVRLCEKARMKANTKPGFEVVRAPSLMVGGRVGRAGEQFHGSRKPWWELRRVENFFWHQNALNNHVCLFQEKMGYLV